MNTKKLTQIEYHNHLLDVGVPEKEIVLIISRIFKIPKENLTKKDLSFWR